MLGQRYRRWLKVDLTMDPRFVFAGKKQVCDYATSAFSDNNATAENQKSRLYPTLVE